MTKSRPYYSTRLAQARGPVRLSDEMLQRLLLDTFADFADRGYFAEFLGQDCVDAGFTPGTGGRDVGAYVFRKLRKEGLWPIPPRNEAHLCVADVFDLLELLYDHVSAPTQSWEHSFNACGTHWTAFDRAAGQRAFREAANEFLPDVGDGFALGADGRIGRRPLLGTERLVAAPLPASADPSAVEARVAAARDRFLRRGATDDDRREAVRGLADVPEYLRPELKQVLRKKDEAELFQIANNFGIRHHNANQQTDYDAAVWLPWMFYHYLTTIHVATRLIERRNRPR